MFGNWFWLALISKINGKWERYRACVSNLMGSYADNKYKLQLWIISRWEGSCFIFHWWGQQQRHSFVCLFDIFLFCFTQEHTPLLWPWQSPSVWFLGVAGLMYVITGGSSRQNDINTNSWRIFFIFALLISAWLTDVWSNIAVAQMWLLGH